MRLIKTFALCLTLLLVPTTPYPVMAAEVAAAATPAETAMQLRTQWAKTKADYLASVQPYESQPASATLVKQYSVALDKAGASLENYIALKLATPATATAKMTPAVDQLIKDLAALRKLRAKAKGPVANVLGAALTQHNEITQAALKNMR